jgi:multiple sugar transport system substrate-binding protein/raffinose/stachyose/melibiose transport system substrate-binding protein
MIQEDRIMFDSRKFSSVRVIMAIQAIILTMIVAQCTVSNEAAEPEEPTPIPTVEVEPTEDTRVQVYYGSYLETETSRNPERVIIDQFEATHPHINVSRQLLDVSPYTVISFLRQNPSFTVVLNVWADRDLSAAMDEEKCLDLSPILSDAGLDRSYPDTFMTLGQHEGKQYFLPTFYSWFAIYYNKEIFDRYDLEPPETWLSFLEVSQALLDNGVTPLVHSGEREPTTIWFDYLNMRLNGPEFHAALIRGEERYDDPKVRDVFETWAFLVESGYVAEETWTLTTSQSRDYILRGDAAMMLMNSAVAPDELGFFRFPIMDPTIPVGEVAPTIGYIIPADVQNPLEATEFLIYLGAPETQTILTQQFAMAAGFLPINREVDQEIFTAEMQQGLTMVQAADHVRQPYYASFDSRLTRPMGQALRNINRGEGYEEQLIKLEEERQRWFD